MRPNGEPRLIEFLPKDMSLADAFECLFENAPDAIYILDTRGRFVAVNRKAEKLTGFKQEDYIGESFRKVIPAKSLPKAIRGFMSVTRGKSIRLELELKTAAKKTVLVEVTSTPFISNGKIVGTLGIVRDITERKQMEKVLRESEEKYRTQFEEALDAVFVADAETGIIIDCNRAASELVGREKSELVGKHQRILHPPEEISGDFSRTFKQHLKEKEGQVLETRVITKSGEIRHVAIKANIFELGDKKVIQGLFRDITEQKKAEEALRASEEKYKELINGMNDTAWVIDFDCSFIDVNDAAVKVLGYSREELRSMRIFDIDFTLDPEEIKRLVKGMPTDKAQVFETAHTTKDGKTIPVEISSSLVTYQGKRAILSIARDITERKKMEERLLESEERLKNLYENIPDSLCVFVGREGRLLEYNKAFKERTGYTDEELKDKKFLDFVHPDDRAMIREKYGTKYPEEAFPLVFEMKEISKKGEPLPIQVSVSTYKKKGKVIGIEVLHRDITERKEMERKLQEYAEQLEEMVEKRTRQLKEAHEQLIKSERLAAIGQVAAMVGHDLRNPLTGIKGATYYLKTKLGPNTDEKAREMLELIDKDVEHSNKIITDLMEYSKEIRLELTETTPKSIVREALHLVEVPKNIQVLDLTQSEPKIKMDVEKMKRVFCNLVKNAVDAMPNGGKLTIASRESDGSMEVAFADTGIGMKKEIMEKIWTPFFSTKAKGMGLGLAICKRIIEAHGGSVSVESTAGKGTTFAVTIPIEPKIKEGGEKSWVNVPESLLSTTKA